MDAREFLIKTERHGPMPRKSKINKKELAAVLRESVQAINRPGPLRIIVDVGDTRYYVQRTLELVTLILESPTNEQQIAYLSDAIFLLGVAKHNIMSKIEESKLKVKLSGHTGGPIKIPRVQTL